MSRQTTTHTGIIAWFASNHVAANLLMFMILVFGVVSAFSIRKQTTPDFEINNVQVTVPYPGAAPQEVEEGVVVKVEEAIQDVKGIDKIRSVSRESVGVVTVEVASGVDLDEVLADVKTRVDALSTLPALTEKPVIAKQEVPVHVVFIALYGNLDEYVRKALAQTMRNDLMLIPSVNDVQILGDRDYEISIEVSELRLRKYALTMSDVAQAIGSSSIDLPGGEINTRGGDILLRTEGQVYTGAEFARLPLRTGADGSRLTVGDVATVSDGFVETDQFARFNGQPATLLRVMAGGDQSELQTAAAVRKYLADKTKSLPDEVKVEAWVDRSHYLRGRLDMMIDNMLQGALLVFIILSLFLRIKVALWVIVGIPVAFFGTIWLMPFGPWPVTINVISLFGFILVLGIVVDDAIIIGESIYTTIRADGHTLDNVIKGTHKVAVTATFGVLTTIAAFAPMLFVGGVAGSFFEAMSVVVILCLMFSLIESKLILPAHLANATIKPIDEAELFDQTRRVSLVQRISRFFLRLQRRFQHGFMWLTHKVYTPLLYKSLANRGVTISVFLAMLILTVGLLGSGIVRTVLFPDVPGDFIVVNMEMQSGTPPHVRNAALDKVEGAALALNADYVAQHAGSMEPINHVGVITSSNSTATIFVEMPLDEGRPLEGEQISAMWRERVGEIAGVKTLDFSSGNNIGGGAPVSFSLNGDNHVALAAAAKDLEQHLATYSGVFDISNSLNTGGEEIRLTIKPAAEALGLTITMLGRQVRQAFYGEEVQRIQRGKDELKVMVRYPQSDRRSVADLENMRIRTPAGAEVPFRTVAQIDYGSAYSSIERSDRKRTITVSADVDSLQVEPSAIIKEISTDFMPSLLARYSGVGYSLEGASQQQVELVRNLSLASLAALFLIYALIAIPLRSYGQPLIIMAVIPFGLVGAVAGHAIMGMALSMFSLFGLIALAGVVVNDSLIMVDFINKARASGVVLTDAVVQSGQQRFRAIILTSLTTAAGLLPILFEKSTQAQFVIPMAVSMSFGILFATVITLFLVPSLYLLLADIGASFVGLRKLVAGRRRTA